MYAKTQFCIDLKANNTVSLNQSISSVQICIVDIKNLMATNIWQLNMGLLPDT